MNRLPNHGEKITFKVTSADKRFRRFTMVMVPEDQQLDEIARELKCALKAWHELPSEEMSDTLMCHLYDKFSARFGIDALEDCP
jgi:hypothetical protein